MKRLLHIALAILLTAAVSTTLSAGEKTDSVLYRSSGYKGGVSLTSTFFAFAGAETSHGYMFNEHHYLGAGAGFLAIVDNSVPVSLHAFLEYRAYIMEKNSSMIAGVKAGWIGSSDRAVLDDTILPSSALEFEPFIGWAWAYGRHIGLNLALGFTNFLFRGPGSKSFAYPLPKLSVSLEF